MPWNRPPPPPGGGVSSGSTTARYPPLVILICLISLMIWVVFIGQQAKFQDSNLAKWMVLKTDRLQPQTFLVHAFSYESGLHLAVTLMVLFFAGRMLEARWGSLRFGIFFLFVTIATAAVSLGVDRLNTAFVPSPGGAWVFGGTSVALAALAVISLVEEERWVVKFISRRYAIWCAVLLLATGLVYLDRAEGAPRIFLAGQISGVFFGWAFSCILPAADRLLMKLELQRRKVEEERVTQIRTRVDQLLEKISGHGYSSLSEEERTFLKQASKHYRRYL